MSPNTMQDEIIKVNNISKSYTITHRESYETIRDKVTELAKKPFQMFAGRTHTEKEKFWALRDVQFSVKQGERLGIIGRNGAGKSTLLKILSQITYPTAGDVMLRGRVASLLEVGTGFHPELTGRENIFLNGAILGMKQSEIRKKFDEIVAFAEIEQFLDTPVKRYSSGMYVRLAFAVAAHLEPEILIIDEVLAVGDTQFQKKCLGKMEDVAKGGRTILFVSHNMGSIHKLCDSCIWLDRGKVVAAGDPQNVIMQYLDYQSKGRAIFTQEHQSKKKMNLRKVFLLDGRAQIGRLVNFDDDVLIAIEYEINQEVNNCLVWFTLSSGDGIEILCSTDYDLHPELKGPRSKGYYRTTAVIPKKVLSPGSYNILVGINSNNLPSETFDRIETISFDVVDNGSSPKAMFGEMSRSGFLQPFLDWQTQKVSEKTDS